MQLISRNIYNGILLNCSATGIAAEVDEVTLPSLQSVPVKELGLEMGLIKILLTRIKHLK